MADHGEVEYATADGNDYAEHEATYNFFISLTKWIVATDHILSDRRLQRTRRRRRSEIRICTVCPHPRLMASGSIPRSRGSASGRTCR